ncbi:M1 family metallopeptidase [Croceiramulus getboli]|nr:M1 family metallopeptidase [Flavobacteriaceae bacterium YJPT1-3]
MKPLTAFFVILTYWWSSVALQAQETTSLAQPYLDVQRIQAVLDIDPRQDRLRGQVEITYTILQDTNRIYLDAAPLELVSSKGVGKLTLDAASRKLYIDHPFQANQTYTTLFTYSIKPDKALYFVNRMGNAQVWSQGQGKYTSSWLPSLDDVNDKIEFDLTITTPRDYTVIANGPLVSQKEKDGKQSWIWDMKQPMSSYLVGLAIGDYQKEEMTSDSGIPLMLYYYPEDQDRVEPTYRYTRQIFDFLERELGVPFPWANYKQIPVKDFLYAGMENTTATIFSDAFVVDSIGFQDRNYVNVNAHEMAHQWFGNLVTAASGTHHWLQEGFATYYALLAERELFGEDYFYWKLYESAEQLKAMSEEGKGQRLLDPGASSLTFYQKGAWALHVLRDQVGEDAFAKVVKNYLLEHQYGTVTTDDFLTAVAKTSGEDLSAFRKNWLEQTAFQAEDAFQLLKKSPFLRDYFQLQALRKLPYDQKKQALKQALILPNDYLGQEAVFQLAGLPLEETKSLYSLAFESGNHLVRQGIALSLDRVPVELKAEFESLLEDDSYVTRELALLKLWSDFPAYRSQYLEQTATDFGFADGNIRTLWLALAIATKYGAVQTHFQELSGYTAASYSQDLRLNAFRYLYQIQAYSPETLLHLVEAATHFNYRFRNGAREIIDALLEEDFWKQEFINLLPDLKEPMQSYLQNKLDQ